jgi:hypothetical protein
MRVKANCRDWSRPLSRCTMGAALSMLALSLLFSHAPSAFAGPPTHFHKESGDITGFNHACGVAVDSKGDVYVSSAGESKVKVFDPAHAELSSISNANEPCGLSVNGKGELFVSERATGKVVRYKPNFYPFSGAPTYGPAEPIDASGNAVGISIDPHDDRLYVAEGDHIAVYKSDGSFEANIGEGKLTNATGVASYTYVFSVTRTFSGTILDERATRYLFAADTATNRVTIFSGEVTNPTKAAVSDPKFRKEISGPKAGEDFGFGTAGAFLAVDPGNPLEDIDPAPTADNMACTKPVDDQACTAGHLLVYDPSHNVVDEFEASGQFLDQFTAEALADAKPTAVAVDRSGGPNDGTIYVSTGSEAGAKVLAFDPLAAPSRPPREELSHVLANAQAVATDHRGNVYVAAGAFMHVYDSSGKELLRSEGGKEAPLIEDTSTPLEDLAVDSACRAYVLENHQQVTYYTPSACPPVSGTTYTRHEPPVATKADFEGGSILAIAINPGPSAGKDHIFVTAGSVTHEYDSAPNGSKLLVSKFAEGFAPWRSIAVDGASGNVYLGANSQPIFVFSPPSQDPTGKEVLARITGAGCPQGKFGANPFLAVDQSNGHVLEFQPGAAAREYDASGACVAEFGKSNAQTVGYRVAVDNACSLHEPPLNEATTPTCKEFDPADGTVYVAFDDPGLDTFDLTAFGRLAYGEPPLAETGVATKATGGKATLNGTVDPRGFELEDCYFEYLTDLAYEENLKAEPPHPGFEGAEEVPCAPSLEEIGSGTGLVSVYADLTGLDPEERYRFRLVARNKYGEGAGDPGVFGPPVPTTESALPILYDEATLRGEVDPSGLATEYHFEYGTSAGYGQSTPAKELPPGDGEIPVQAALTGLEEGRTYHFRIVAENEAKSALSSDQTFTTLERRPSEPCANIEFRTGLSANLPDCRAYELVTPAETNGLSLAALGAGGIGTPGAGFNTWPVAPRGSGAGERLSFGSGTLPGFDGNGIADAYRASRDGGEHPAAGWSNELFSPSYAEVVPDLDHRLAPQGVSSDQEYSFWNLEQSRGTFEKGIYLRTLAGFEVLGKGSLGADLKTKSHFVSAGGSHVIFSSKKHLEEEAAPVETEAIYDRVAGDPNATVVSLRPDGDPFGAGEDATYVASSEDGSAVLFKVNGVLYLRHEGQTTEVAEAPNTFAGVSEDGQHVFYAATSNGAVPAASFVCTVEAGPCAGTGSHAPIQIAANSIFVNVSADGSRVLFTSEDAFTGSEENEAGEVAETGKRNLYIWETETETTRFVAQLHSQDFEIQGFGEIDNMNLSRWTAAINAGPQIGRALSPTRSTPDGDVFLFQSHAQLTSYDNGSHGEIYRYEPAVVEAGERLLCVSCDPSGAPASADALLENTGGVNKPVNESTLIANVTDDGSEVFFESTDRILPEDANSVIDVYEWKAKGAGSCKRDGGCLALISSGQGDTPSYLYGMSADGHDVFFGTQEKLVGADVSGSPSIYDARVGGGIPEPTVDEGCDGDACQPQSTPPALPSPASTPAGDGTVEEGIRPCAKGKRRVKGRCVKPHRKPHHRHRRAHHNRGGASR